MARAVRERRVRVDEDGVRIHELSGVRGGVWLAVLAIVLVGVVLLMLARRGSEREVGDAATSASHRAPAAPLAASDSPAAAGPPAAPVAPRRPAPVAPVNSADVPAPAPIAEPGDQPPQPEAPMFEQAKPGEQTGVALFPPPGTKPIKRGLLVPEDFELPSGYVRHYQATDDGQRVPAILMFHPDYHPVDEHGEPIALPEDRVVPPDMAPAGMPIEVLELPDDQAPADAAP